MAEDNIRTPTDALIVAMEHGDELKEVVCIFSLKDGRLGYVSNSDSLTDQLTLVIGTKVRIEARMIRGMLEEEDF